MWVSLILEIFQEALILPLYHQLGATIQCQTRTKNKLKIGVMVTFFVHLILSGVLIALAWPLLKCMAQKQENLEATVIYIRLELCNIPLNSVNTFFVTTLTVLMANKHLYVVLLLRMCSTIATDTCFLSTLPFSLQLGVKGIAYGNLISTCVVFAYCCVICWQHLHFTTDDIFNKSSYNFSWMKSWTSVGLFSGLDSLIRNVFYILCVLRMMNVVEEQGLYWRSNEFIWNWLLLLYLPLANVLKQDACGDDTMNHKHKLSSYILFVIFILLIWLLSLPLWKLFFISAMHVNDTDAQHMLSLVLLLLPFYLMFMVTTLLNSVFYAKGRTHYLAIKSTVPNLCINLPAFVLFIMNIYRPTVRSIALLFGSTMALGECLTIAFYIYYLRTVDYKI
jgi:Na+-driven multidrug efflux pump